MQKLTMGNIKHKSGGEAGVEGEEPGGEELPNPDYLIKTTNFFLPNPGFLPLESDIKMFYQNSILLQLVWTRLLACL